MVVLLDCNSTEELSGSRSIVRNCDLVAGGLVTRFWLMISLCGITVLVLCTFACAAGPSVEASSVLEVAEDVESAGVDILLFVSV